VTGFSRSLVLRSDQSPLVAPFATAWTTTHQFAVSRTDWALSRGEIIFGARCGFTGELLKLGIVVSERTVSRYLAGRLRRPSQTSHTFLANHVGQFTCMSSVLSPYAAGDDVVDASARIVSLNSVVRPAVWVEGMRAN
jgi:hypothetical protein